MRLLNHPAEPALSISRSAKFTTKHKLTKSTTPEVCPDALTFARERLGFVPDDKQAALLSGGHNRLMLNCSRQWGKSTVTAAKAIHVALSKPGSLILVAAPAGRQSGEFVYKVKQFGSTLGLSIRGDGHNNISILFPNRSRIIGLPGSREANVRAYSAATMVIIDEAARVPDELYMAVSPMVAVSGGDIWLLSTPWRTHGFFYQEWKFGEGWEKVAVRATECPRIPKQFLEQQRTSMGEEIFRREFMCEFHDAGGSLFTRELIERCFTTEVTLLFPELTNYEKAA